VKLFLGIDGGGSGTTAVVGDESGTIRGRGRSGPLNDPSADVVAVLREAVAAAAASHDAEFESACIGLSGGEQNKEEIVRRAVHAKRYLIANDASIALAGTTEGAPGVIAIAGTGSIAFGRNAELRTARAGGWGYVFGDEGSAFDIVRQALRAALRFEEAWGAKTALREALIASTGARDANDLLHRFYSREFPRARIAAMAPLVDRIATEGDPVAADILKSAAQSLASFAAAVRGQLFAPEEIVMISYAGGVFESSLVRERFRMLVELNDANRFTPPKRTPSEGALLEAYRIAGVVIPALVMSP
jgi:N-acetylglucosamine kinase